VELDADEPPPDEVDPPPELGLELDPDEPRSTALPVAGASPRSRCAQAGAVPRAHAATDTANSNLPRVMTTLLGQ
jgi:hypothetical protein